MMFLALIAMAISTSGTDTKQGEIMRRRRQAGRAPNWVQLTPAGMPSTSRLRQELGRVQTNQSQVSRVHECQPS